MPARKPATPPPLDEWGFTGFPEIAERFGLSQDALAVLAKEESFPVFSRKICPALMKDWLLRNSARLRGLSVA